MYRLPWPNLVPRTNAAKAAQPQVGRCGFGGRTLPLKSERYSPATRLSCLLARPVAGFSGMTPVATQHIGMQLAADAEALAKSQAGT